MDLVSSIRKTGSRGGVNFNWEDVATSNHRENYLGHSLKAPVGRWAKGKDLTWYAKADASEASSTETEQERAARERKEELKRIKEAEEDALARALGLPVAPRKVTGANAIDVSKGRGAMDNGDSAATPADTKRLPNDAQQTSTKQHDSGRHHRRRHRSRSRSRERHRDRSPRRKSEHHSHRSRDEKDDRHDHRRRRSYSLERGDDKHRISHRREHIRSRSPGGVEQRRDRKESFRPRSRDRRPRRNESPQRRERRNSPGDHHRKS
ncbi:kinase phosphorylation protein-domain-containing protein [Daldinia decipiens]|uniref:kinase phosphorylation protein-domain-containing protein n=1 Tax=Daldinia decipiens TaxID=326647 RepID=UPI0020C2EDC7|nr:kinase phosphorylation protein-domain-containing protein [Daldinia decipiens]KAI1659009.1 kinase phosphorylation protein-domain-containing protein [Daldinia decipiens]